MDNSVVDDTQKAFRFKLHQTIKKVGDDVGRRYTFNTAIAANMELLNEIGKFSDESDRGRALIQEALEASVLMLSPIVPHVAQVLWASLGHEGQIIDARWPEADDSALVQDSVPLIVQVNGKMRGKISVPADADNGYRSGRT